MLKIVSGRERLERWIDNYLDIEEEEEEFLFAYCSQWRLDYIKTEQ